MLHLRWTAVLLLLTFSMSVTSFAEESGDDLPPPGKVRVEPLDVVPPKPPEHDFKLLPYKQRRTKWGLLIGLAYSSYAPIDYGPAYAFADFSDVYGGFPNVPLAELQFTVKRNFDFGSVGIEVGGGYFDIKSNNANYPSELKLTQARVGLIYVADMLFDEPYVAPYVSVGGYVMVFNEAENASAYTGTTQIAPYVTAGVMASLDWLDPDAKRIGYQDSRMQATYVFAEIRKYFASYNSADPDLDSTIAPGGGLRVEF